MTIADTHAAAPPRRTEPCHRPARATQSCIRRGGCMAILGLVVLWLASTCGTPALAQVYRCGNSYSHTPCAGGKAVDTRQPLSVEGGDATNTVLYLCRSYGGGQFWTREHCAQRRALVERMESVPANMGFEQQVEMAQGQRDRSQAAAAPAPAPTPVQPPFPAAPDRSIQCASLEQRIRQLDQMARAGGTAQYMDWVANERKVARDQQFRLRC
jgi:hypothetical protein